MKAIREEGFARMSFCCRDNEMTVRKQGDASSTRLCTDICNGKREDVQAISKTFHLAVTTNLQVLDTGLRDYGAI